jgi:hypothetical protein
MQHMLAMHRAKYGLLCQCLARLAQAVAVSFATHDFRRRWLVASPAVREEHILKGLVRACSEIESFRRYCDELTLPYLQRGGGHGFLDLLKHFTLDDYTQVPTKPIYLKSSHWYPADPTAEPKEAYELADAAFNVERSSLIGMRLPSGRHEQGLHAEAPQATHCTQLCVLSSESTTRKQIGRKGTSRRAGFSARSLKKC